MRKHLLIASLVTLALTSCSTSESLYSWHDYENVTYQYSKKRTEALKASVLAEYQAVIQKQKGSRGVVPPGMYAEYGYMLYRSGKHKEGISFMKQEIELYPEADKYISRIIKQLEK